MSAPKPPAHFVLGTVQLGQPYGKIRKFDFPSHDEAVALMRRAADLGVREFDTARNYGVAEMRLGDAFDPAVSPLPAGRRIVTKLHPLQHVPADAPEWAVRAAIDASVYATCRALRIRHIPLLMLHLVYVRDAWNGAAWRRLLELREEGVIGDFGMSAVSPEEALRYLDETEFKHMQVPINILDHRWMALGAARKFATRPDVTVHARSIFLQGVLLQQDPAGWPPHCTEAPALIAWLREQVAMCGLVNVAELAVAYLRALGWLDGLVVGVENEAQLTANLPLFDLPPLDPAQVAAIDASRPQFDDRLLEPGRW